ncbi:hypothetical protein INQ41_06605 [Lysobacter ciconiae]|uniref:Uncharacterized protein n=1 Tax=Novilysobacter ciconiae TaxID=2781022 RepID=A0A7S6ZTD5_9GAMM|nr:hypothetical protein INQ41_06605 [Lysobacter ciconiae]
MVSGGAAAQYATVGSNRAAAAEAPAVEVSIGKQLDELGYEHDVDDDGDYKLVLEMEDDRTQLAYVRSPVHEFGSHRVREIWSPAYRVDGGRFPAPVSVRLLEDSHDSVLGGWVKQGDIAMFVVKLAADASATELKDAIAAAVTTADAMETELSPGSDEF